MRKKSTPAGSDPALPAERFATGRRRFLGEGAAFGGLLAALGVSEALAQAQGAPRAPAPPGPPGPGGRPPPPPEPKFSQPPPLKDLAGKVAYVTASSDGIGLGIARACSEAGMKVVIGYRNEERLKAALPLFKRGHAGVLPVRHDVTDREGWKSLLAQVRDKYGNLHLLVNNAGVKTLKGITAAGFDDWDNAVAVNFTGIYNGLSACLPHMLSHGEGAHIVTTASMAGLLPGSVGIYSATKIGAVGLMEALRVELESTTVGTSVLVPGAVKTDNYPVGARNPFTDRSSGQETPPAVAAQLQAFLSAGMDPLECGRRVLNGVRHNDLFIITHPEFGPGIKERFDAVLASEPAETPPAGRAQAEQRVLHCGIYKRELAHRLRKRKSYIA